MANYVIVDGKKFISEDYLVTEMVKACVIQTTTSDLEVMDGEREMVTSYQYLLDRMNFPTTRDKFHNLYVQERFVKRTLGV